MDELQQTLMSVRGEGYVRNQCSTTLVTNEIVHAVAAVNMKNVAIAYTRKGILIWFSLPVRVQRKFFS